MSDKDFASANNFINWLVDLINTFVAFIKRILGKEDPAPAEADEPAST